MNGDDIIILTDYDDKQLELDLTEPEVSVTSDTIIDLSNYGAACETITMSSSTMDTITLPTTYTVGYGGTGISYTGNGSSGGGSTYATGVNTSSYQWTSSSVNPVFTIGGSSDESSVKIAGDKPTLSTDQGSVNVNDVIDVVNAMKQMIIEMAKDDDLPEKYDWVRNIAHEWMLKAIKGPERKDEEDN